MTQSRTPDIQYALFQKAIRTLELGGATPRHIHQVVSNFFGFRLPFFGPFATAEMARVSMSMSEATKASPGRTANGSPPLNY